MNYWSEDHIKSLGEGYRKQEGIGQNITIPFGILADCDECYGQKECMNNDVFAATDFDILERICNDYKGNILDQRQMISVFRTKHKSWYMDELLPPGKSFDSMSVLEIFQRMFERGGHMNNFLCKMNLGQLSFMSTVTNMMKDKSYEDFDFAENGGEYLEQSDYACDISWCEEIYIHDKDGKTQLHLAIKKGHLDLVIKLLFEHGADVNIRDEDGNTPLHLAIQEGHLDLARQLVDGYYADVNIQDKYGNTPAYYMKENNTVLDSLNTKQHKAQATGKGLN